MNNIKAKCACANSGRERLSKLCSARVVDFMEPSSSSHNWDESPPPYRGRGYQKLGQADEEHQMYPYRSHHAPPTSYAPAPASMPPPAPQHSSFSNNVR